MRMHATRRWEDCCEFSDLVSPGFGCKILRLRPARAVRVPRRTPVEWPVFSLRNQSLPPSLPQSVKPAQPEASASPFRSVLRSDIPMAVRAMNVGAIDFLTKPVDDAAPLKSVAWAFQLDRANRREAIEHEKFVARYETLTPREREVLALLVRCLQNKQAAFELWIAEYTVQVHRAHIMRKKEADSFAIASQTRRQVNT
jgi:DNA-binding CsgD family transcriptional regulator